MKAAVFTQYGAPDVLQIQDVAKPTPKNNEVLIKIRATTVTLGDCEIRAFKFPLFLWIPMRLVMGIRKPRKRILGQELSGEVEAVGKDVTTFKQGDQVFATTGFSFGAYAEYICLPEAADQEGVMAIKPANITFEEATAVPLGGLVSLYFLRRAEIQRGEKVLINGAGGSIGTFGVQLAKSLGAEVTAVDSAPKLKMLLSIGADHVIDYAQEDFTRNGERYDVIFDVAGKAEFSRGVKALRENGRYLLANPRLSHILRGLLGSKANGKKIIFGAGSEKIEDLLFLKRLIEAGTLKSIIDRRYPLAQIAEAHRYVESGRKQGHVVITI